MDRLKSNDKHVKNFEIVKLLIIFFSSFFIEFRLPIMRNIALINVCSNSELQKVHNHIHLESFFEKFFYLRHFIRPTSLSEIKHS